MKTYKNFKKKLLQDREIKQAYEKLAPEYALVEAIIRKRLEKGLTQQKLAERLGTKQSAISRLESGSYNPSLAFLNKLANALDSQLRIGLV